MLINKKKLLPKVVGLQRLAASRLPASISATAVLTGFVSLTLDPLGSSLLKIFTYFILKRQFTLRLMV